MQAALAVMEHLLGSICAKIRSAVFRWELSSEPSQFLSLNKVTENCTFIVVVLDVYKIRLFFKVEAVYDFVKKFLVNIFTRVATHYLYNTLFLSPIPS